MTLIPVPRMESNMPPPPPANDLVALPPFWTNLGVPTRVRHLRVISGGSATKEMFGYNMLEEGCYHKRPASVSGG